MKKVLLILMLGLIFTPSFAGGGKGKKKQKDQPTVEIQSTPVVPVNRERWIEREGNHYVIVTRTTITAEDYRRIRDVNK